MLNQSSLLWGKKRLMLNYSGPEFIPSQGAKILQAARLFRKKSFFFQITCYEHCIKTSQLEITQNLKPPLQSVQSVLYAHNLVRIGKHLYPVLNIPRIVDYFRNLIFQGIRSIKYRKDSQQELPVTTLDLGCWKLE